jgi:5-formyltetrahydrofolate cyclo-ligase
MRELASELLPPSVSSSQLEWSAVQSFRKAKRSELLARRDALTVHDRRRYAESLTAHLRVALELDAYRVLGFYWPIRGELDLRSIARRHLEGGGIVALPVIVAKNAPVEFWQWELETELQRGFWNIPVPAVRRPVAPDALLVPLVGYDAGGYRLGYGGGYYDRTLALANPRPFCIGVGYDAAAIETIHPRPHDIAMHMIVTERRSLRFERRFSDERR